MRRIRAISTVALHVHFRTARFVRVPAQMPPPGQIKSQLSETYFAEITSLPGDSDGVSDLRARTEADHPRRTVLILLKVRSESGDDRRVSIDHLDQEGIDAAKRYRRCGPVTRRNGRRWPLRVVAARLFWLDDDPDFVTGHELRYRCVIVPLIVPVCTIVPVVGQVILMTDEDVGVGGGVGRGPVRIIENSIRRNRDRWLRGKNQETF